MLSNLQMKKYQDPEGNIYWIQQEDEPKPEWVEMEQPIEIPLPDPNYLPPYTSRRQAVYPYIGEQLDMIWHAIDSGTLDKTSEFYTTIASIKESIPKE